MWQQHVIKPSPHRQNCCQKMVHLLLLHFWIPRSMSCNAPSHSLGKKTKESAWISMTLVYRVRLLSTWINRQNMKVFISFHISFKPEPHVKNTTKGAFGIIIFYLFRRNFHVYTNYIVYQPSSFSFTVKLRVLRCLV